MSRALETTNIEKKKRKLNNAMEVLHEVSVTFTETKEFIDEKLEQKCSKENISVKEVICFSLTRLEANIFLLCSVKL